MKKITDFIRQFNGQSKFMTKRICLIFTLFFFIYLLATGLVLFNKYPQVQIGEHIAKKGGDTWGYLAPMEHFIEEGEYYVNEPNDCMIGRGPYYAVPYFLFRQIASKEIACDLVALLQIILVAVAFTCLMKCTDGFVKNKLSILAIPFIISVIYPLCYYLNIITELITEALTLAFSIFFVCSYVRYRQTDRWKFLIFAGLWLAIVCVMKPYFLPVFGLCGIEILISKRKTLKVSFLVKYMIVFALPLILICLPFTIRNYVKCQTFAPMQNTTYAGVKINPVYKSIRDLILIWGENYIYWEDNAMGTFFSNKKDFKFEREIPKSLIIDGYTLDDIYKLRDDYFQYRETGNDSLAQVVIANSGTYQECYKKEHPLTPLTSRLWQMHYLTKTYINNPLGLITYYGIHIFALIGLFLMYRNNKETFVFIAIYFWLLLFFSIMLAGEHRFFLHAIVLSLVGFSYLLDYILSVYKKNYINSVKPSENL